MAEAVATGPVALIADCGSGATRMVRISRSASGELEAEKLMDRAGPLATLLSDGRGSEALDLVGRHAAAAQGASVIIGATAGMRIALVNGAVTQASVDAFCEEARARFPRSLLFVGVLSTEEEALGEYASVLHKVRVDGGLPGGVPVAGVASGGGMSGQIVLPGRPPTAFSYRNLILDPGSLCDRASELSTAQFFEEVAGYRAQVERELDKNGVPSGLPGVFATIEWLAYFIASDQAEASARTPGSRSLSLGYGRLLDRDLVVGAADALLEQIAAEGGQVTKFVASSVLLCALTRVVLLRCFAEGASLFCIRGISWPLGHYLNLTDGQA